MTVKRNSQDTEPEVAEADTSHSSDHVFVRRMIESAIRIGILVWLASLCWRMIYPFMNAILFGVTLAVTMFPLLIRFEAWFGGRRRLAVTLFAVTMLGLVIGPAAALLDSLFHSVMDLSRDLQGHVIVPPPPDRIKTWPLIGPSLHEAWMLASTNLPEAIKAFSPQLEPIALRLSTRVMSVAGSMLEFVLAIVIACLLMAKADGAEAMIRHFVTRLSVAQGDKFIDIAKSTVRSVAQGVIGIASIQALAAGLALIVFGVPWAGLWSLAVFLLAIVQLPSVLVLGPICIYVFSEHATFPAVAFTLWSLLVGVSDSVLKPILLGRGSGVPMLVILVGSIGGLLSSGLVGLFVGPVILAVSRELFLTWLGSPRASVIISPS